MPKRTPEQKENFIRNLRYLMNRKNCSLDEAAKGCGIKLGTFKSYYYGEKFPRQEGLQLIANYFGVALDALLSNDNPITKHNEMMQIYHQISDYYEERRQTSSLEIIEDYIVKKSPAHLPFKSMCNVIGIIFEYVSTRDTDEVEEFSADAEYDTNDIVNKMKHDEIRFASNSEALTRIQERELKNGASMESIAEKIASIQSVVAALNGVLSPNRRTDAYNKTGLDITAQEIKDGLYSTDDNDDDTKIIDSIPVKVKISTTADIKNLSEVRNKKLRDLLLTSKEFTLLELIELEDNFVDSFFNIFLS